MLASDVLNVCRSTLIDPSPGTYWTDAELVSYLNQFVRWAVGLKPDLSVIRTYVALAAGVDQDLPTNGMQFLDAHFAGNGQAVFIRDLDTVKHAKFANVASAPQVANVQVVCSDPRDPRRYHTFPPALANSSLEITYSAIPADMTDPSAEYTLPPETSDAAYAYVLSLAYRKTTKRQDVQLADSLYQRALAWFGFRTKTQLAEAPTKDG